jgi:hypothetical protein
MNTGGLLVLSKYASAIRSPNSYKSNQDHVVNGLNEVFRADNNSSTRNPQL